MAESRLKVFDHSLNTAHIWVADVARQIGTDDRRFAYWVLRAWLHTLRDRLTVDGAAHFAAQLPVLLRGVFYEGWQPSRVPVRCGPDQYSRRFAERARIPVEDAPWMAATVTYAIASHLSPGQLSDALAQLPQRLRCLMLPSKPIGSPAHRQSAAAGPHAPATTGAPAVPGREPGEYRAPQRDRQILLTAGS
jgi:uncharacterized protein (DUF2267 family)